MKMNRDWADASEDKEQKGLPAKPQDRGVKEPPSISEGTSPAATLISNLQPPELGDKDFLLIKPPSLWHFVMAALGNKHIDIMLRLTGTWKDVIQQKYDASHPRRV